MIRLLPLLLLVVSLPCWGTDDDQHTIDSLKQIVNSDAHDTTRVVAMIKWDGYIWYSDPELDEELNRRILKITNGHLSSGARLHPKVKKKFLKSKAYALNSLGIIDMDRGHYDEALEYFDRAYEIHHEIDNRNGMSSVLNNKGIIYEKKSNYPKALDMYLRGLKIEQELENEFGISQTYNNIGIVYEKIEDYDKALSYYRKSVAAKTRLEDKPGLAKTFHNIGNVQKSLKDLDSALYYFNRSLELEKEIGNMQGVSDSYLAIGEIYQRLEHYSTALSTYEKSLAINKQLENRYGDALLYQRLAEVNYNMGKYDKAITYCDSSRAVGSELEALTIVREAYKIYYLSHRVKGNTSKALEYFEKHIELRDSLNNAQRDREIIEMELRFDYEKKAKADSVKNAQREQVQEAKFQAEQEEKRRLQDQSYFIFGALGLALLAGGFIFNRFRVTRRQRNIIQDQKSQVVDAFDQLEEKNKEVLDSINYAKRIQDAILPSIEHFRMIFPGSVVMYRPKDIVAGDFYWIESFEKQKHNTTVFFAAADCTGHGVPGAMVSVVCHNSLNRVVREYGLSDPGEILGMTRELVVEQLSSTTEETGVKVRDGMDIALCALNRNEGRLRYAGAHNPLWLLRKETGKVEMYRASRQAIGMTENPRPFETTELEVRQGDWIYLFSDGYVDQFGGESGKKFKYKAFMRLIERINHLDPELQLEQLNKEFDDWKGPIEQIDDVCVIGVQV